MLDTWAALGRCRARSFVPRNRASETLTRGVSVRLPRNRRAALGRSRTRSCAAGYWRLLLEAAQFDYRAMNCVAGVGCGTGLRHNERGVPPRRRHPGHRLQRQHGPRLGGSAAEGAIPLLRAGFLWRFGQKMKTNFSFLIALMGLCDPCLQHPADETSTQTPGGGGGGGG